jgi:acyl-CoA synthetase (NDP forming)
MSDGTTPPAPDLNRLLRPRSVAIVGASPQPGQLGNNVLANLERCNFPGPIHLVSRNRSEINGRPCVPTLDDLPMGVDAVVLIVPEVAMLDAAAACARRGVGGIVAFAAGFAEVGGEGRAKQDRLVEIVRAGGIALNGPNCSGLVNFVDGIPMTFEPGVNPADKSSSGVGIIAQSGGMMGNIRQALKMKGVPTTWCFSTGNEAALGVEDYFEYLLNGMETRVFALFIEQVRHPARFLALVRRARELRRPVVMMHPGRTQRAREAALTHTGALAGDHAVMATVLRREGVLVVDTLDEFFDVTALLVRWPEPPAEGAAVVTNSGAFRGVALDFGAEAGLALPQLAEATRTALAAAIPAYATADNPLDLTTVGAGSPDVFGRTAEALLGDPAVGGLITAFMPGAPHLQLSRAKTMLPVIERLGKPVAFAHFCDGMPLAPDFLEIMRKHGMPLFASPDRAMRAMARLADYGRILRQPAPQPLPQAPLALGIGGTVPEYRAKQLLAAEGVPVGDGALARDVAEAEAIAARIGYPVALKAQAAALAHKSDAGGVILNLADAAALRAGWDRLSGNIARARPELRLDGVLVERMAAPGLEMILGARRDPDWGPILLVGLGGVWTEALGDVRLIPADLDADGIVAEIGKLKGAALLRGMRGTPPLDMRAVAATAAILGRMIRTASDLREIEINPLAVYPTGVLALDALMHVA